MKRIKGKYIRVTQEELNRLIESAVNKRVSDMLDAIIPRQNLVYEIGDMCVPILEYWYLVHYCTMTGKFQDKKDDWKFSLIDLMDSVSKKVYIKGRSESEKIAIIVDGFGIKDVPSTLERLNKIICPYDTFGKIDKTSQQHLKCIEDCHNEIPTIIQTCANMDYDNISRYVESI